MLAYHVHRGTLVTSIFVLTLKDCQDGSTQFVKRVCRKIHETCAFRTVHAHTHRHTLWSPRLPPRPALPPLSHTTRYMDLKLPLMREHTRGGQRGSQRMPTAHAWYSRIRACERMAFLGKHPASASRASSAHLNMWSLCEEHHDVSDSMRRISSLRTVSVRVEVVSKSRLRRVSGMFKVSCARMCVCVCWGSR